MYRAPGWGYGGSSRLLSRSTHFSVGLLCGPVQFHNLASFGRFQPSEDDLQVGEGFFGGVAEGAGGGDCVVEVEPFVAEAVAALLDWDSLGRRVSAGAP